MAQPGRNGAVVRRAHLNRWLWAVVDAVVWMLAVLVAYLLRFDFDPQRAVVVGAVWFALAVAVTHVGIGVFIGPYAVGHQRGSFEETYDIARTAMCTVVVAFLGAVLAHPPGMPRSIPLIAGLVAITAMFAARFVLRTLSVNSPATSATDTRVVLFGAGDAGRQLLRSMVRDPASGFTPVALLDDDRSKARLRIEGVRVCGNRDDMAAVAERYGAQTLVIALPSAEASLIRDLSQRAAASGLQVLVLPALRQIITAAPTAGDLRNVDLQDLLGRRPVDLDCTQIADQLAGRRVLVTGAGGSIGAELCQQISRFGPSRLYLLDRDESGLQATQLNLSGEALLDSEDVLLVDIRDGASLRSIFRAVRPEVVFHAAALKHLPLLESFPTEAWQTNVLGTLNVLQAAAEVDVLTFVNISTDKAADPACVLGLSKRVAERLTAQFALTEVGRYVSVRFGNVLGSRGSVLHAFRAQIARGGPVTVTHPEVQRFFMLIPEACQLVLQASSLGSDGEVLVLDMGEQVKIVEVANTLIRFSGRSGVDIVFTGLRQGEKLGEELFARAEQPRATEHPLICSVSVPPLDSDLVLDTPVPTAAAAVDALRHFALDRVAVPS
ncbi:MAG TPA: nucleoside-diphosphate sugar epimerase/dehydratase [Dermatophilaceae bacterium]|nr:nucleoside-diphosphate sugar epimerase/dehydratase [Dermatophilaceae bacterium]